MAASSDQPSPKAERTQLFLDSVARPVTAAVQHRTARRMRVRQALPFLELQGGLSDAEGRRGRISSVAVEFDGSTPSLVVDVLYEGEEDGTLPHGADDPPSMASMDGSHDNDYAPVVFRAPVLGADEERISSERVELYSGWEELRDRLAALPALLLRVVAVAPNALAWLAGRLRSSESAQPVRERALIAKSD